LGSYYHFGSGHAFSGVMWWGGTIASTSTGPSTNTNAYTYTVTRTRASSKTKARDLLFTAAYGN